MNLKRSDLFKKWNKDKRHTYDLSDTLSACPSLDIAFIYSGRNRGKSFEIAAQCLADAWYDLKQFAYIRRNDATAYEIENYFNDKHDFISDMTDGLYTGIAYYKGQLCFYADREDPKTGKLKRDLGRVAGSFFAVSRQSSYKSQQYPEIYNALFEEVLTDGNYLSAEPEKLMNLYSTLRRSKEDFKMYLISNTVSAVNPYSKAWGIYLAQNKPGDIRITKLYLDAADEEGNEKYLTIAAHYLEDLNPLSKTEAKKNRNRIKTGVASNKWDELKLYTTIDLSYFKQFQSYNTLIFEYDDMMIQCDICEIPDNTLEVYQQDTELLPGVEPLKLSDQMMPVAYFRRKTGKIKPYTRTYTNNAARLNPYTTKGFKCIYGIDTIFKQIFDRGWIIGADNLTMNDFRSIFRNLSIIAV